MALFIITHQQSCLGKGLTQTSNMPHDEMSCTHREENIGRRSGKSEIVVMQLLSHSCLCDFRLKLPTWRFSCVTTLSVLCDHSTSDGGGLEGKGRQSGQEIMTMSLLYQCWDCNSSNSQHRTIYYQYTAQVSTHLEHPSNSVCDLIDRSPNMS